MTEARRLRVLSFTPLYPRPNAPIGGIFVRARLQRIAETAAVQVIAPAPLLEYGTAGRIWVGPVAARYRDENLEIRRPRWLYPPLAGFLNPFCLFLGTLGPVLRLRREFPFDLIDAHFGYPAGVAAALLAAAVHKPFTVTLRGSEVLHAEDPKRRALMRRAFLRAGRVITVSARLREFAIGLGVPPERVTVISNGVDSERFFPRDPMEQRRKHGIPEDARVVLSAGNLIELKGHHRIVAALKPLLDSGFPVLHIVVGGQGSGVANYEFPIRQTVSALGMEAAVRFTGQVSQDTLSELMSAADVFCLASSREGWPNVVHEAMACGTPVVATDVGAIPEMIPSDRYGLVTPFGDAPALTSALRAALDRNWDRAAISQWAQSRSWSNVALETLEVFRQVVEEAAAR
jgi:teichuronic acid biosynthesis glycosyltransferase TuaC